LSPSPARPWTIPLLLAGLALVVRLVHVWQLRGTVLFDSPVMDAAVHDLWARGLWTVLEDGPWFRAPGYIWFLRACYAIDAGYLLPRLVQAVLSAATVGLVADLAGRLGGRTAALAGGLLLTFCWPVVYFAGELLIVTPFCFLLVASLWCLVRSDAGPRWGRAGAALLGLAGVFRPTALTLLPALVWMPWWRPGSTRDRLVAAGILGLLALAPGLGLTVRNGVVGGDWVFMASQGGVNFHIGNNRHSDGSTAVAPGTRSSWVGGYEDTIRLAEEWEGRPLRPSEVSRYWFGRGFAFLTGEPGAAARLYAFKLRHLLVGIELSNNQNLHWWRHQTALLSWPWLPAWPLVFSLAVLGLIVGARRRGARVLWLFLVLYAAGILLFFVNERFRTPLTVVLCVFSGVGVAWWRDALRNRRWRAAGLGLLLVAGLFLGIRWDRAGFPGAQLDRDVGSRLLTADAHVRRGEPRLAIAAYRDAARTARRTGSPAATGLEREIAMRTEVLRQAYADGDSTDARAALEARGVSVDPLGRPPGQR